MNNIQSSYDYDKKTWTLCCQVMIIIRNMNNIQSSYDYNKKYEQYTVKLWL